jgi:phosphomannomutase / phosphoglucomutase
LIVTTVNPAIFREYDIRGVVDRDLTEPFARLLGQACGTMLRRAGHRRAAIGYDVRPSSPGYSRAMAEGMASTGVDVIDVGLVPTPGLYWALWNLGVDGGVMITGSHNPPEFNGFKVAVGHATIYGQAIQDLRRLIEADDFERGQGTLTQTDIIPDYMADVAGRIGRIARPVRVIADCGNGCASLTAHLLDDIGAQVTHLYCQPDGTFPNHHPDPTLPASLADLIAKVKATGAELGLAFDGDADRLGVVDAQGRIIWGDHLLIIYSREILAKQPGAPIIFEVKCSQALVEEIQKAGGRPIMYRTGHSLIKEKMKESGAPLAGEMSGHLFFADEYYGYDDAVYGAARLLRYLAAQNRTIEQMLSDVPHFYSTPEIRVDCPDDEKFQAVERMTAYFKQKHEVIDVDGARVLFGDGWGLVRASNTQPVLVLRFEAKTPERLEGIQREMLAKLAEVSPVDVSKVA